MKNKKIVIDIAIIPGPDILEKCIFVNSQLNNSNYVLFKDGYYPHLTLGMGCVSIDDLDKINYKIKQIISETQKSNINIVKYSEGNYFSFEISKDDFIKNLHKKIMEILEEFSYYGEATKEMFYEPDKIRENSGLIDWVNNFNKKYAYEEYNPHISLGEGDRPHVDFPFGFTIGKIAVFNIGVHGTCIEKIMEFNF